MTGSRMTGSPNNNVDPHQTANQLLRSHGHRYTAARRRIVEVLGNASGPLTVPQLIERNNNLAESSTYRNLSILQAAGVVMIVVTPDDHTRFELDELLTEQHHHHLICTDCGDVQDFELSESVELLLNQELDRTGRAATFRIDRHRLDLLGACAACI